VANLKGGNYQDSYGRNSASDYAKDQNIRDGLETFLPPGSHLLSCIGGQPWIRHYSSESADRDNITPETIDIDPKATDKKGKGKGGEYCARSAGGS
jgi:hypothetical protein